MAPDEEIASLRARIVELEGQLATRIEEAARVVERHGKNCQYASDWSVCTDAMAMAIRALAKGEPWPSSPSESAKP